MNTPWPVSREVEKVKPEKAPTAKALRRQYAEAALRERAIVSDLAHAAEAVGLDKVGRRLRETADLLDKIGSVLCL